MTEPKDDLADDLRRRLITIDNKINYIGEVIITSLSLSIGLAIIAAAYNYVPVPFSYSVSVIGSLAWVSLYIWAKREFYNSSH
jgi:hypothetical protein